MKTGGQPHVAAASPETFREEFRDAISPRSLLLGVGTGVLCLVFLFSYLAAFHAPLPHRVRVAVIAPSAVSATVTSELNAPPGAPLSAIAESDEAQARADLGRLDVSGIFIVSPTANTDRLLVASGAGVTLSSTLQIVFNRIEATQSRTITVTDAVPHQAGDTSGGAVFYVVLGCILSGYLLAASISTARGNRPVTQRRTLWRLGTLIPYAALFSLGSALLTDQGLGAIRGHFLALWSVGALLVLAAAATTVAFQILFDFYGIAATILVFVVLGSPSSGGAYPYTLLPTFWRSIGPWLPNGAGVDALRRSVYFGSADVAPRIWVITAWVVVGSTIAIVSSHFQLRSRGDKPGAGRPEAETT